MLALFRKCILYYRLYKQLGFRFLSSVLIKTVPKKSMLFNRQIHFTDEFWFFHSLQEIFIERVYLFKSQKNSPLIIDCGANIGLSIIYFKQLFPESAIVAFEPDPLNFQILKNNIEKYDFTNVQLLNKAVWKKDDVLTFSASGSVGSRLVDVNSDSEKSIKVESVALSRFLSNNQVDFLKIDIEGAEYEVLFSCKDKLSNVQNIFIEYHSMPNERQSLADILNLLQQAGFRYYIRQAWENLKYPYINQETGMFDLQLNIFAYRN